MTRTRPSRSRRLDDETAELARRRLDVVLRPRRALPSRLEPDGDGEDLELDRDRGIDAGINAGIGSGINPGLDGEFDGGPDGKLDNGFDTEDRDGGRARPSRMAHGGVPTPRPGAPGGLIDRARTFTRGHLGVVLALAVVALLVAAAGVARARPLIVAEPDLPPVTVSGAPSTSATAASGSAPDPTSPTLSPSVGLVVHVLGAVRHAGVVRLPAGARVGDAIKAAGGLAHHADPGDLNLAQPLLDGQQVVVVTRAAGQRDPPERSEVRDPGAGSTSGGGPTASGAPTGSAGSSAGSKVNLNTATAEQLDGLSGVGPVTAQRVLDWRAEHGRFSRIEELQEVDGIGPKTFAELAPQVTV